MKESYQARRTDERVNPVPINVMHIIDKLGVSGSSIHGVTRALAWWIPRFNADRFRFSICSLRAPEPAGKVLERAGIPVTFLSKHKLDPTTLTALLDLIKRESPDILHLHGFGAANFGRLASLITGIPNIVHEHVVFLKQPAYQTIADACLSPLTSRAIAISAPVYDYMVQMRKIQPDKLETFFYGIPLTEFQAPAADRIEDLRRQLGIADDEQVISTVGRLDTQKGQIYLLKAAALILKKLPNVRFLIVGDGPDREMLERVAAEEGILERVIFTGYRDDVPALLTISDVFAVPSLFEGGPLTIFEAMNLHKPVVGTPTGLIPDVVRDDETGFIVPCADAEQLAEKLLYLLENPTLAQAMGQRGWQVCQEYDISKSVERLGKIYMEMSVSSSIPSFGKWTSNPTA
jgi:glycosyltransferase involved in cell wall biosynthesis